MENLYYSEQLNLWVQHCRQAVERDFLCGLRLTCSLYTHTTWVLCAQNTGS